MATKIEPVIKTKTVSYTDKLVENIWLPKPNTTISKNHKELIENTIKSVYEGFVCIQTEVLTDTSLIKLIFDIAQNSKVRFYILVNQYSKELDQLNEICLIRYEVNNVGSLVLVNPNTNVSCGIFFTGQLTEQSLAVSQHTSRELKPNEIEDLFRHFCYQFWETAKKEVIEEGKHTDITSKPVDVFHDINAFDGKNFVYGTLFDFAKSERRGNLVDKQIIYLNQEKQIPITIIPSSIKDLGDQNFNSLLPKSEYENFEPQFIDDGVSVNIEFKWRNIPFYLPANATINSLYDRWKKKQEEIIKALDSVLNTIQEIEKNEGTLPKAISRFFLGKKNVFNALKSEIDDLKKTDYANLTEIKLKEKINRINEIYKQVNNEIAEIDEENRKAKLDEEIEDLKKQISELENVLENKKKELEEKLKDEEQKNFAPKTQGEINDIEKKIKSLKNQMEAKEKEKNKQITQSSSSSLNEIVGDKNSKQNISNKNQLIQIPDLNQYPQLPQIGILYQLNSQPYLAIEFWEQYELGIKEANRLKAKLCATKK